MIDYILLGKRIKKYRKAKHWTQAELAEQIGKSPNHISKIETAKTIPSLQVFVDIANALETPMDKLMYGNLNESSSVYAEELSQHLRGCTAKQKVALISIIQQIIAVLQENRPSPSE